MASGRPARPDSREKSKANRKGVAKFTVVKALAQHRPVAVARAA